MNNKHQYAFYGSLRPGMYNFDRFKEYHGDDIEVVSEEKEIEGYRMYSLGAYPYTIKTNDPNDKVKVTLVTAHNNAERQIHNMEIGAGYEYSEVLVDGENYGIYLFPSDMAYEDRFVEGGDWVKFKTE